MKKLVLLTAAALVIAACGTAAGSDSTDAPDITHQPNAVSAVGPGISIEEALASDIDQPVLVNGFIYIDADGNTVLTSMFAESLPPIPGGEILPIEGLDPTEYELSESQGVRWTDQFVQVLGVVDDGTLVVSPTVSG